MVESYLGTGNAACFTNAVTEILAGDNRAGRTYYNCGDEEAGSYHIATIAGEFGRMSNVTVHLVRARRQTFPQQHPRQASAGEGLECILNDLYLTRV